MHNLIVHSVVSLDLTGELHIAGEDHIFTLGILSDVPSVSIVVFRTWIHRFKCPIIAIIGTLSALNPSFIAGV